MVPHYRCGSPAIALVDTTLVRGVHSDPSNSDVDDDPMWVSPVRPVASSVRISGRPRRTRGALDKTPCDKYSCDKTHREDSTKEEDAMNPATAEAIARAHLVEARRPRMTVPKPERHAPRRRSVRCATGWFLVNLGLRLALPRRSLAPTPVPR
jgi:hypothetical protein